MVALAPAPSPVTEASSPRWWDDKPGPAIGLLALAAAVGAALAGCHPTGTTVVDQIYAAVFAALVTLAAARASRGAVLVLAAVGFALSRSWMWLPALAALGLAFGSCFPKRRSPVLGALAGALSVQVVLRWPQVGFHGLTALLAAAAVLPVLISAGRRCSRRTRRLVGLALGGGVVVAALASVLVLLSAFGSRSQVEHGISIAKASIHDVESAQSASAEQQYRLAAEDLQSAHHHLSAWWNLGGYLVPGLAQQERAMSQGVASGSQLVSTAARYSPQLDFSALRMVDGRVDLAAVEAMQKPAAAVDQAVIATQADLRHISSPWLVGPLQSKLASLSSELDRVRSEVDLGTLATKHAPALLGADGPRRYFVAFTTPAETRGLGGFIGAYGILTVDDGSLHLTASGRPIELSSSSASTTKLSGPASYLARYGAFDPQRNLEDVTYAPNFPTVGQVISQLYPQLAKQEVDGVLLLDPDGLAALLQLTGPVQVAGLGQLTSANAADVLLRQQYLTASSTNDDRHDYLQAALQAGFDKLSASSFPAPETIGADLGPAVREGRLMFWSSHASDRSLLDRLGLTGAFPGRDGGDLLAVTLSNSANNKIDAYLHQSVTDDVRYDPATGSVSSTVNVDLHNAAASTGLPDYVIGSYAGSGLAPGTNLTWLSLYTPLRLASATVDGQPVMLSGPVQEDGVNVYSAYIRIPASSTAHVVISLKGTVSTGQYKMTTRLQPLANAQSFSVSESVTGTTEAADTWTAGTDQVQTHTWKQPGS